MLTVTRLICLSFLFSRSPAMASGSPTLQDEPLMVEPSQQQIEVTLGEPVVISLPFRNRSGAPLDLVGGWSGGLPDSKVEVVREDGSRVPEASYYQEAASSGQDGGIYIPFVLRREKPKKVDLVVTRQFRLRAVGRYQVRIHLVQKYREMTNGMVDLARGTKSLVRDVEIPFIVLPTSNKRLREVAEGLRDAIAQKDTARTSEATSLEALFSMPEAVASPYWRAMALDDKSFQHVRGSIVLNLMRLGTKTTIGILRSMWERQADTASGQDARGALEYLYRHGSPGLKGDIGRIFLQLSGTLPSPDNAAMIKVRNN